MQCSQCSKQINSGNRAYVLEKFAKRKVFCSEDCCRDYIVDHVEDLMDDDCYEVEIE